MTTPPSPGIVYWIAVLAAVFAFALAQRRAEHRPIAWFLAAMAGIDLVRFYLRAAFDLGSPGPYEGARRLAFHMDELGFLAWPAGLIALALVIFAARRAWVVAVGLGLVWALLVGLYPSDLVRGEGLHRVYLASDLCALAAIVASVASWGAKRLAPGPQHAVMFVIGAIEIARLASFNGYVFTQWAVYAATTNAVLYVLLCAVQGGFIWSISRRS